MKPHEIDQVVSLCGQLLNGNVGNRITVELQHGIMYLLKENLLRWPPDVGAEPASDDPDGVALMEASRG